jgi:hypothetical protein
MTSIAPTPTGPRQLGTFYNQYGLEQCEIWRSTEQFRAGAQVGNPAGYDSLKEAVADLGKLTKDEEPSNPAKYAVAVLRKGDRFEGRELEAHYVKGFDPRSWEQSQAGVEWYPVNFEYNTSQELMEIRPLADRNSALAAIVDGEDVHRFRAPKA